VTICAIRCLALTVSDVCSRLVCFLSTSTLSALQILHIMRYIRHTNACDCACIVAHSRLYWTEKRSDGKGRLMECRLDGSELRTVLGYRRQGSRWSRSVSSTQDSSTSCSCPHFSVTSSFAVDQTQADSELQLYIADSVTGDIWSTDTAGCHCQLIVNATTLSLTPSDIGQSTILVLS